MAYSRTAQQMNQFATLLKTSAGRQKLAANIGPSLRRRRDYMSIARKALMVETLADGALPVYDKEFDETGRSFVEGYWIAEEGGEVAVRRNPKRIVVSTFTIASLPEIPITQIKERRFDMVARSLSLAKSAVGEQEDKYIFRLLDVIDKKSLGASVDDPIHNATIAGPAITKFDKDTLADAYGAVNRHDIPMSYIFVNARDYVDFLKWQDSDVDRETQRKTLKTGVMGYLWGMTILQSRLVKHKTLYMLAEQEFLGVIPERIPLTVMSADVPQKLLVCFSVFQNAGFLIFNTSGVQVVKKA